MKSMKIFIQFAAFIVVMFLLQGYSCIGERYYGPPEKETRKVGGFDAIEVSHGIEVYLTMDSTVQVNVEAAEDLLEHLVTEVKGETLKIYFDRPFNWNSQAKVWIQAKEINMINISGGVDFYGESLLETRDLEIKASGGSDIRLEVKTKTVDVDISGGADVVLSGSTVNLWANSSGGSDLNAFELVAQKADLDASGGSDIKAYVEEELDANASGGADISYRGNPQVVNTKTSASGDITHRN